MTVLGDRIRDVLGLPAAGHHTPLLWSVESGPVNRIRNYIAANDGAAFQSYAHRRVGRNQITGDDVVAVTMLSIEVRRGTSSGFRPRAVLELERRADEITSLLDLVPHDRELHTLREDEFERWLGDDSPGTRLYDLLRREAKVPRVATSKLLARKRPDLLPIRDTVVERALGMEKSPTWWRPWWEVLSTDDELVASLRSLRTAAGAEAMSLLRVADVAIWMQDPPADPPDDIELASPGQPSTDRP